MNARTWLCGWAVALASSAWAVEGMWPPAQLPQVRAAMTELGYRGDPNDLSDLTRHPMNAVVWLQGCTAAFVSDLGLVLTNHHCAYGSIQFNSTAERNLLRDGFLAATLGEELRAEPNARILVTEAIEDVSARILRGLDGKRGLARWTAIDRRSKDLVQDCEKTPGYRCDVYVFNGGQSYQLVKQLEIRDVRLVYAPKEAIGKFGGDVDNWMWPRHTGDFAFYRAYVGPDGRPAPPAEVNVPYRPKSYLRVDPNGVAEGQFVMVAGYPGRTHRHRLSDELEEAIGWLYPSIITRHRAVLALIDRHTRERPEAAVKYAAAVAGLNNGLKNFEGLLDGFKRGDPVGRKRAEEEAILAWSRTAGQNGPGATTAYTELRRLLAEQRGRRERDQLLQYFNQSPMYTAARDLVRLHRERAKPNEEREFGFQQRDEVRIEGRLRQFDQRWDAAVDRALWRYLLDAYLELPSAQRIAELDAWLGTNDAERRASIDARLDALAGSELTRLDRRLAWFKADAGAIERSTDPALVFARTMLPAWLRIEAQTKAWQGEEAKWRAVWMAARQAYAEQQGRVLYPDANASLRVSFGTVQGVAPRDAVQLAAFTTDRGIVEKHTGLDPFDATAAQIAALTANDFGPYARAGRLPVNFLADLDITGGNSGSPTLNGKGELIGVVFDGNYEAISSGWIFEPALTRSIHVDIRYLLWVMDRIDRAHRLMEEMKLTPAFR